MRKKCEICGFDFPYNTGKFTIHLMEKHNLLLKDYIILYELSGVTPKCECGYCDEDAPFFRGKFLNRIGKHQKYEWLKEQYIKKFGTPKCNCGREVKFRRGLPNDYCSPECFPNRWNQDQVRKTVKEKYGVDCVSLLDDVKEKMSEGKKNNYKYNKKEIVEKFKKTCFERYGFESSMNSIFLYEKWKKSIFDKLGVDHPSKTLEFRNSASKRMIKNNSLFDFMNYFKVKKYKNTDLTYQSLYEYHFLEFCEKNNILEKIKNGNVYDFLIEQSDYGFRTLTDFCIGDIEIEIKSTYILEKQGGYDIIEIKKAAVERSGKQYLLILDKNYKDFKNLFKL